MLAGAPRGFFVESIQILVSGTTTYWREVVHCHIFSDVNDLIPPDRNPMWRGFGREIAHCNVISDVNNFILRESHPLEARGSPCLFYRT